MTESEIQELSQVVQSSNLNFLFGAGVSRPFLPLLGNIERDLNETKDAAEKEAKYKEYYVEVMLPNKKVVARTLIGDDESRCTETKQYYKEFFETLSELIIRRKSTILSKQVNLFTTNIDVLMETVLEELQVDYNDGFAGRIYPTFGLANFKKAVYQRSLHFEHVSEIPVFNIIKIHGSLTWKQAESDATKIIFAHRLEQLDDSLLTMTGDDFALSYKKILVVNPEEAKHLESVLNVYYSELLRLYASELEKENALLFIVGFSMEDRHIREITLRAAKSNPTLRILLYCSEDELDSMRGKMGATNYSNIKIVIPDATSKFYTLEYFCKHVLSNVQGLPK